MPQGELLFFSRDALGEVRVFDDGEKRMLSFGAEDEQSVCLKADPAYLVFEYTQAMLLGLLFDEPRKILCLGLGSGSLIRALQKHLKGIKITAVELRQIVIDSAQNFFYLPQSKRLNIHCAAAEDFLKEDTNRYDLIFSDLYLAQGVAEVQQERTYLEACNARLKQGGVLVLNFWGDAQLREALREHSQAIFQSVSWCSTREGNGVVFAAQSGLDFQSSHLRASAREWSRKLGYPLHNYLQRLETIK